VSKPRKMKLMAYLKTGRRRSTMVLASPATELDNIFAPERYEHIARVLEAACFDGCFYADTLGLPDIYKGSYDTYLHYGGQLSYLDPVTVLPVMARVTKHLGLGATLSTTFHHPTIWRACWPRSTCCRRTRLLERRDVDDGLRGAQLRMDNLPTRTRATTAATRWSKPVARSGIAGKRAR